MCIRDSYCRPKMTNSGVIDIKGGRHPVVEKMITNDMFIEMCIRDSCTESGKETLIPMARYFICLS